MCMHGRFLRNSATWCVDANSRNNMFVVGRMCVIKELLFRLIVSGNGYMQTISLVFVCPCYSSVSDSAVFVIKTLFGIDPAVIHFYQVWNPAAQNSGQVYAGTGPGRQLRAHSHLSHTWELAFERRSFPHIPPLYTVAVFVFGNIYRILKYYMHIHTHTHTHTHACTQTDAETQLCTNELSC